MPSSDRLKVVGVGQMLIGAECVCNQKDISGMERVGDLQQMKIKVYKKESCYIVQ